MNDKFLQPYSAQNTEDRISKMWEDSGFYNPDEMVRAGLTDPQAEPFSIVLPPPNVTGTLHTGHASMLAIEDIMTRYHRMLGRRTLWLPGTDHAAIATQSKVEKILSKEKLRKHDIGREAFLDRVHTFAQDSHDTIVSQAKKMGASLDWSREAFTLDKEREHAVYTAFKRMYDDGLIYKAHRIVNWDVKGQTVISDDEIVHVERDAKMYTFKYSADFPIAISTTRPETKVGDTAVAVHPDDPRYTEYIGKTYNAVFCGSEISVTIVADHHVDMELGTGALGVTPAHAIADWEIAGRTNVVIRQVIDEYGKMMNCGDILEGMKVAAARERVVEWLQEEGLLIETEDIKQNVSTAERSGGVIEPLPKMQWWIDTEKEFAFKTDNIAGIKKGDMVSMKQVMLHVVENGSIDILPERFKKTYYHWIKNLRPWNISRQIWYGHRIPVWYKGENIHVGAEAPENDVNFAFIHGFYRTNDVVDPLKWLNKNLGVENSFCENLPHGNDGKHTDEEIEFILENSDIDEKTVVVTHSRGAKTMFKILQEKDIKIKGLIIIAAGIGHRKIELDSEFDTYLFNYEKIQSLVEDKIVLFEPSIDHVRESAAYTELADKLSAKHIKTDKSESHYNQETAPEILQELNKYLWKQDEDTLDTWFSSGLWTFSTLGWPDENAPDLQTYHPTNVLETGHDIIFFWVARMILMTTYLLGDIPFKTTYFHGLVRDSKGRKMSKSLGNIVNPMDLTAKYGTDALRMAMIVGNGPGNDVNLDENKIKAYSKFANKLWNITRFILTETDGIDITKDYSTYSERDIELIKSQDTLISEITTEMNEFRYYIVSEKLYHYAWDTFASEILEESKSIFESGTDTEKESRKYFLMKTLKMILKTLHPFMPFITEEIWQELPKSETERDILMTELWPN